MNFSAQGVSSIAVTGTTASDSDPDPSGSLDAVERVLSEIRQAAAMTEGTFVGIGQRLETAISTIDGLTATFRGIMEELGSAELLRATADLSQVSNRITALARAPREGDAVLGRIGALTEATTNRVGRMRKAVQAVDVLAVNAKIAAAHLGAGGDGFSSFAEEITRAMKIAEENLDGFAEQLGGMTERLREASRGQRELNQRRDQAIRTIPGQLARSVAAIAGRRQQAEATASGIQKKTVEVGQRVGNAVMAMQIGDTTRQRIEHVEFALSLAARLFGRRAGTAVDLELSVVAPEQKRQLLAAVSALSIAQLSDTAAELDGQVGEIAASLARLAGDAREIAGLGKQTYAASDLASGGYRPDSFLSDLEEDVSHARTLLEDLRAAQTVGDSVMAGVLATTESLVKNISAIQSLEADIRLMGLNTTLRSSRLGHEGRALTVIAQELRTCSNMTATEAEAVLSDLDAMVEAASVSSSGDAERRLAEVTELSSIMVASVELLSRIAAALARALQALDGESAGVASALQQTASELRAKAEIGAILRRASAALAGAQDGSLDDDLGDPAGLLAAIAGKYTMAREREIHARILGGEVPAAPSNGAADDIFF